jgi:hypothetical protein
VVAAAGAGAHLFRWLINEANYFHNWYYAAAHANFDRLFLCNLDND